MKLLIKVIDAKMHVLVVIRNEAGKVILAEWKFVPSCDPRVRLCCGAVCGQREDD